MPKIELTAAIKKRLTQQGIEIDQIEKLQQPEDGKFLEVNLSKENNQPPKILVIGPHVYLLEKELGKGAFGQVYLGMNLETGDKFAVKVGNNPGTKLDVAVDNEQKILNRLKQLEDKAFGEAESKKTKDKGKGKDKEKESTSADNRYVTVMKLASGKKVDGLLYDLIVDELNTVTSARKHPLDSSSTLEIMAQLTEQLDILHESGVIHGDIKQDNLLWDAQTQKLMIIDFGEGILYPNRLAEEGFVEFPVTEEKGNPLFIAPELTKDSVKGTASRSIKSDNYAAGLILADLLSSYNVWEKINENAVAIEKESKPVLDKLSVARKELATLEKSNEELIVAKQELADLREANKDELAKASEALKKVSSGPEKDKEKMRAAQADLKKLKEELLGEAIKKIENLKDKILAPARLKVKNLENELTHYGKNTTVLRTQQELLASLNIDKPNTELEKIGKALYADAIKPLLEKDPKERGTLADSLLAIRNLQLDYLKDSKLDPAEKDKLAAGLELSVLQTKLSIFLQDRKNANFLEDQPELAIYPLRLKILQREMGKSNIDYDIELLKMFSRLEADIHKLPKETDADIKENLNEILSDLKQRVASDPTWFLLKLAADNEKQIGEDMPLLKELIKASEMLFEPGKGYKPEMEEFLVTRWDALKDVLSGNENLPKSLASLVERAEARAETSANISQVVKIMEKLEVLSKVKGLSGTEVTALNNLLIIRDKLSQNREVSDKTMMLILQELSTVNEVFAKNTTQSKNLTEIQGLLNMFSERMGKLISPVQSLDSSSNSQSSRKSETESSEETSQRQASPRQAVLKLADNIFNGRPSERAPDEFNKMKETYENITQLNPEALTKLAIDAHKFQVALEKDGKPLSKNDQEHLARLKALSVNLQLRLPADFKMPEVEMASQKPKDKTEKKLLRRFSTATIQKLVTKDKQDKGKEKDKEKEKEKDSSASSPNIQQRIDPIVLTSGSTKPPKVLTFSTEAPTSSGNRQRANTAASVSSNANSSVAPPEPGHKKKI